MPHHVTIVLAFTQARKKTIRLLLQSKRKICARGIYRNLSKSLALIVKPAYYHENLMKADPSPVDYLPRIGQVLEAGKSYLKGDFPLEQFRPTVFNFGLTETWDNSEPNEKSEGFIAFKDQIATLLQSFTFSATIT